MRLFHILLTLTIVTLVPAKNKVNFGNDPPEKCPHMIQVGINKVTYCNVTQKWEARIARNLVLLFSWIPVIVNFAWMCFLSWATGFSYMTGRGRRKYQKFLKFIPNNTQLTYQDIGVFELQPIPRFRSFVFCVKWVWMPWFMVFNDLLHVGLDSYYYYKLEMGFHTVLDPRIFRTGAANDAMIVFSYIGLVKNALTALLVFGSISDMKNKCIDRLESDGDKDLNDDLPIVIINERLGRRVPGRDEFFGDSIYVLSDEERIRFGLVPEEHEGEFVRPPKDGPRPMNLKEIDRDPNIDMSLDAIRDRNRQLFISTSTKKAIFVYPTYCIVNLVVQDGIQLFLQFFYVERYIVIFDWMVMVKTTMGFFSGVVLFVYNIQYLPYQISQILSKKWDKIFYLLFYFTFSLKSAVNLIRLCCFVARNISQRAKLNCYTVSPDQKLVQTPFNRHCLGPEDRAVLFLIWLIMACGIAMCVIQYRVVSERIRTGLGYPEEEKNDDVQAGPVGEAIRGGRREGPILVIPDTSPRIITS
ncbi:hypothetical protein ACHWQZ_G014523 [Mnemiopsis leidyi]